MPEDTISQLAQELSRVVKYAYTREGSSTRMIMSNSAADHWGAIYAELTEDHPGMLGAVTSRAEAQVLRLSMIYALLAGADHIGLDHLEFALALWRYSFDSAAYIFGQAEFDPIAQRIIEFLAKGDQSQNDLVNLFGRNQPKQKLDQALSDLQSRGRITLRTESSGGRPRRVWSLNR